MVLRKAPYSVEAALALLARAANPLQWRNLHHVEPNLTHITQSHMHAAGTAN